MSMLRYYRDIPFRYQKQKPGQALAMKTEISLLIKCIYRTYIGGAPFFFQRVAHLVFYPLTEIKCGGHSVAATAEFSAFFFSDAATEIRVITPLRESRANWNDGARGGGDSRRDPPRRREERAFARIEPRSPREGDRGSISHRARNGAPQNSLARAITMQFPPRRRRKPLAKIITGRVFFLRVFRGRGGERASSTPRSGSFDFLAVHP